MNLVCIGGVRTAHTGFDYAQQKMIATKSTKNHKKTRGIFVLFVAIFKVGQATSSVVTIPNSFR